MQIIVSYDTDVANAPSGFKACVNAACQYLDALLTSPITVTIGVGYGTINGQPLGSGSLGESLGSFQFADYGTVAAALAAENAPGASSLPASAPNGASLVLASAQAKALGLRSQAFGEDDGYVGFTNTVQWNFDPTQSKPIPFSSYDFVGTVLHEVSEALGRVSYIGTGGETSLLDLVRYSSAGTLQLGTGAPSYFSVDGGVTRLLAFNNYVTGDQGDLGDWADLNGTNDAFNDNSVNGVINPLSGVDKTLLQALGFAETAASQALSVAGSVPTLSAAAAVSAIGSGQDAYVAVSDSGANVSAQINGLEVLAKNQNLAGITLTSPAITLSAAQITSDADALNAISGTYSLSVSDSAADIQANLTTLASDAASGKLASVAVTDSSYAAITVTPNQLSGDSALLSLLSGNFYLAVDATGSSNVSITGLSGKGTVVDLSGSASQYTLTPSGNGIGFTLASGSSTDHLSNVTALSYSGTLDFVATTPGSGGVVTSGNVTELYGAVFGREPDVPGLAFYQAYLKANPSTGLTTYAQFFISSPEYVNNSAHNYAQSTAGDTQFITDSYQNLLHRAPESGAVPFYLNVIAPFIQGLTPGTSAYAAAEVQAHALVLTYFSQSAEFLGDVQITAQHPADSQHWLYLI